VAVENSAAGSPAMVVNVASAGRGVQKLSGGFSSFKSILKGVKTRIPGSYRGLTPCTFVKTALGTVRGALPVRSTFTFYY
jgi:hypothetical protein